MPRSLWAGWDPHLSLVLVFSGQVYGFHPHPWIRPGRFIHRDTGNLSSLSPDRFLGEENTTKLNVSYENSFKFYFLSSMLA